MMWDKMKRVVNTFEDNIDEEQSICKHDAIVIDGFLTCQICGTVLTQILKVESDDFGFKDEKKIFKTKYSQITEIKKHFLDYTIRTQIKISNKDFKKFVTVWNSKNYFEVNKKNVEIVIKECNLNLTDINKYLNIIQHKGNIQHKFSHSMINFILQECAKFILFYKRTIKNINKKCLIYTICKRHFNMLLYDYIGFTQQIILAKYEEFYFCYQTALLIEYLKRFNLMR